MMQGQSCEMRQEKSKMSEQEDRETLQSQQENREMISPCQISCALVPASHSSHKRSRTAGECLSFANGQRNCPFTPPRDCHALASHEGMAPLFVPHSGKKKNIKTSALSPVTFAEDKQATEHTFNLPWPPSPGWQDQQGC